MLQTWFSDILVANEDEGRVENYELGIGNFHVASQNLVYLLILKILFKTNNQGNHINPINHGSDK